MACSMNADADFNLERSEQQAKTSGESTKSRKSSSCGDPSSQKGTRQSLC